jgi:glycosyltransferase involved in cell wall biosynthesis
MSKIEFVIPTYNRVDHLMCLLNSLCAQTNDNWVAHVIADCPPQGTLDKVMRYFKGDDRFIFTILPDRYNDWGHTPRNIGLEMAKEDWVVMTGEDNYYTPVFVDEFLKAATPNSHFIYCDMVHNWLNFEYIHLKSRPVMDHIDIGNFMTRSQYAKQLTLDTTIAAADGKFVEDYLRKFPDGTITYIKKILYVHN